MATTAESKAITTHRHEQPPLSYLAAGASGPPVVLLHGWGAFKELWWSTLTALAPNYRAFAPDLPGHGGSPLSGTATMSNLADLIADFCAAQGLSSLTLVGHSMGGNIALELALRRPDLVQRLVLVDAAVDAKRLPIYVHPYDSQTHGWTVLRLSMAFARHFHPLGMRVPHLHGGGWFRPWLRRSIYSASHDPAVLRRLLRELFANPLGTRASQITMPTLVVTGQFDGLVPAAQSRLLAATIPGAQFVVIPGALHNPMDERPRAFEQALQSFLSAT